MERQWWADVAHQLAEIQSFGGQAHSTGVPAGQAKQRLHEAREPIDFLEHAADRILVFGRGPCLAEAHLTDAPNHR